MVKYVGWGEPSPDYTEIDGRPVLQEKYLERLIRSKSVMTPKYCDNFAHMSLLVKNETQITVHVTAYGTNCPTASSVKIYSQWDILTSDPRSNQVIHRFMYNIKWSGKPAFWKTVNGMLEDAMTRSVEQLTSFFISTSVKYLAGEPYENATYADGEFIYYAKPEDV